MSEHVMSVLFSWFPTINLYLRGTDIQCYVGSLSPRHGAC